MQAEELAQHMRRVIWRSSNLQQDPDVSILGTNLRDASPSPLHGTYQDNAIVGADTLEELQKLSKEMEKIVFCSGFTFKETLMSGNPVEDLANPKDTGAELGHSS